MGGQDEPKELSVKMILAHGYVWTRNRDVHLKQGFYITLKLDIQVSKNGITHV